MKISKISEDERDAFIAESPETDTPIVESGVESGVELGVESGPLNISKISPEEDRAFRGEEPTQAPPPRAPEGAEDEMIQSMLEEEEPLRSPPPQPIEQANRPLPPPPPAGFTDILPQDMPMALEALGGAFASLTPNGVIGDFSERMQYSMAVMENPKIGSDIRAQVIEQFMLDGKIVPEALPETWWNGIGVGLQKRPAAPQQMGLPPGVDLQSLFGSQGGPQ